MYINRAALKARSRERLLSCVPSPVTTTLVYFLVAAFISFIQTRMDENISNWSENVYYYLSSEAAALPLPSGVIMLSGLFTLLLSLVLAVWETGYSWFSVSLARGAEPRPAMLFDVFNNLSKVIVLHILIGVFTFLWSLLLFFPGIIASYRYRLAIYILRDHPDYGALQCIRESKRLMRGAKMDLFILDLSFIGWYFLIGLTFGILSIWKLPYITMTFVYFYESVLAQQSPPPYSGSGDGGADGGYRGGSDGKPPWEL